MNFMKRFCSFLPSILMLATSSALGQGMMGLDLYSRHFSDVLAGDCRSQPSCSAYARECIAHHGTAKGAVLTCDRLIRCGNDHTTEQVLVDGAWKSWDPVNLDMVLASRVPFFPSDSCYVEEDLALIRSMTSLPDPSLAILHLHQMLLRTTGECRQQLHVQLSKSYRKLGMPSMQMDTLTEQMNRGHLPSQRELVKVFLQMDNVIAARELVPVSDNDLLSLAISAFEVQSPEEAEALGTWLPMQSKNLTSLMRKRPWMAGTLGLIPGLGYWYVGQPESALSSAILTSAFLFAAHEAWTHDLPVTAGIATTFGLSFFTGSIAGPIRSLKRQRARLKKMMAEELIYRDDLLNVNVH